MSLEFKTYKNESGGVVQACIIDEDNAGTTVRQTDGKTRDVEVGDVLVKAYRPQEYDVFVGSTADEFRDVYKEYKGDNSDVEESVPVVGEEFDPNEHSAVEVREYLSRDDVEDDEKERVIAAEKAGKNRSSAIPA